LERDLFAYGKHHGVREDCFFSFQIRADVKDVPFDPRTLVPRQNALCRSVSRLSRRELVNDPSIHAEDVDRDIGAL
jgi:hypothetical protein